jgi:pentatricopeptide repeat protein
MEDLGFCKSFSEANGYFELGMFEDAGRVIESMPRNRLRDPDVLWLRLQILARLGRWASAERLVARHLAE